MGRNIFALFSELREVEKVFDDSTVEVVRCRFNDGDRDLTMEFLKMKSKPDNEFLPTKVMSEDKVIWRFADEKAAGFKGLATLHKIGSRFLIAFVNGKTMVKILLIFDIGRTVPAKMGEEIVQIGGHDLATLARLKLEVAKQNGLFYTLTVAEKEALEKLKQIRQMEEEEAEREKMAERKARAVERVKKIEEIKKRRIVPVVNEEGRRFIGLPVTENEWPMLAKNSSDPEGKDPFVILVDSFDQESGRAGQPLEAFYVIRDRGNHPTKAGVKTGLSFQTEKKKKEEPVKIIGMKIFKIDKRNIVIQVVDMSTLKSLKGKVNHATYLAVPVDEKENKFNVFSFPKGEPQSIGHMIAVS